MKISAVAISCQYSDFLAASLPFNRTQFDEMVVVTDLKDAETRAVCDYYNVRCITTDVFYEGGAPFNKAKGINEGIKALTNPEWIVHLDADIVLPPRGREIIERKNLDPSCCYSVDRYMVPSYEAWAEFLAKPRLQHELDVFLHTDIFPIGTRIVKISDGGYVNIGYFQMWHTNSNKGLYPTEHQDAARSDMLFSLKWPPDKRRLLGDLFVYHLATDDYTEACKTQMGINWSSRVTKRFAPSPPPSDVLTLTTVD